ncbi:cation:proton antiporter [Oxalobacter aliiformigenes]|uniref:Cation:proton antiporter n=1 Tax=Oxalobacter aliiformigenes TaxID=2946593 RepID=A0ABY7JKC7_9BURK|nr:monovalent cation:proton antiporter family protein [Oxalobacter aliiformigenes]WAV93913.1 cation:proton antiporter [Oxalobacter aliiformigenes]WAV94586.1 cation:proton antiporter [Oxalobacter aliiformigenes]WAV97608.1 cation:proton antiporter [Oxalobacter aliiformigenes]
MQSSLEFVLLMLGTAVIGVVVFRYLQLPSILGYLAVGVVIGPHSTGLVSDAQSLEGLAEFGVVFLMFTVGLEFSLSQLLAMRRIVFGLGLAQVSTSIIGSIIITLVIVFILPQLGASWQGALAMGGAWAMSSTAIVSKMLAERMELETDYGRRVIGILLFQDLAVVLLLIIVPTLAKGTGDILLIIGMALGKTALVLVLLLFFGKKLMSKWLGIVAGRRSQELFMLNLLLMTLGAAWITEQAGLSMELGAFIAGMLISETRYKNEVDVDIKSFRDVLLGLFFITIGMMLDMNVVLHYWWLVLLIIVSAFFYKFALAAWLTRLFGASRGVSIKTGLALAQAGEFSFVLVNQISGLNMVEPWILQVTMASMVLSMLAAPFIILNADKIVMRFSANEWIQQSLELTKIASSSMSLQQHVILAGFGRTGQNIATLLEEEQIPYRALDMDLERVRKAETAGANVSYADATRRESLVAAGIHRASSLIITFASVNAALRVLHYAKELAPSLPVIVRSYDDSDFDRLKAAGADEVVPEVIESSLVLTSYAFMSYGVPMKRIIKRVQAARASRYAKLREYFHGETDEIPVDTDSYWRLHALRLPEGAAAVGKMVGEMDLPSNHVEITMVRRGKEKMTVTDDLILRENDVLVLRGTSEGIGIVEELLLK